MHIKKTILLLIAVFLMSGCGSRYEPFFEEYNFDFDPKKIDVAIGMVEKISEKWNLDTLHMNPKSASYLNTENPAFSIQLFVKGQKKSVAIITNLGVSEILHFHSARNSGFDDSQLRAFSDDVLNTFQKQDWAKLRE